MVFIHGGLFLSIIRLKFIKLQHFEIR